MSKFLTLLWSWNLVKLPMKKSTECIIIQILTEKVSRKKWTSKFLFRQKKTHISFLNNCKSKSVLCAKCIRSLHFSFLLSIHKSLLWSHKIMFQFMDNITMFKASLHQSTYKTSFFFFLEHNEVMIWMKVSWEELMTQGISRKWEWGSHWHIWILSAAGTHWSWWQAGGLWCRWSTQSGWSSPGRPVWPGRSVATWNYAHIQTDRQTDTHTHAWTHTQVALQSPVPTDLIKVNLVVKQQKKKQKNPYTNMTLQAILSTDLTKIHLVEL